MGKYFDDDPDRIWSHEELIRNVVAAGQRILEQERKERPVYYKDFMSMKLFTQFIDSTRLREAKNSIDRACDIVSSVLDDEQECLDNIPDNLQNSDQHIKIEDAIYNLEFVVEELEASLEALERAEEKIDESMV